MHLINADIILEFLYKREKWRQAADFLNKVKSGETTAYILLLTIHSISAILGKPELISKLIREILTWRGLGIIATNLDEELAAAEKAEHIGLDFDKTDVERIEPY